jgi:hypothetical protein
MTHPSGHSPSGRLWEREATWACVQVWQLCQPRHRCRVWQGHSQERCWHLSDRKGCVCVWWWGRTWAAATNNFLPACACVPLVPGWQAEAGLHVGG